MKNNLSRMLPILIILALSIYGCSGGNAGDKDHSDNDSTKTEDSDNTSKNDSASVKTDSSKTNFEIVPVEVQPAQRGDISQYLILSSNLKTEEQVAVYPEVSGIVRAILVDEGDKVDEGDTLLILDDEEKTLNRNAARLDFEQLSSEYEITLELQKQNLGYQEQYEKVKFDLERAKISFERAELELRRTRVLAPISGYIAQRTVNRGDLVNTSNQLYSLVNPTDMIAEVHIPEAELPRVDKKKKVTVRSDVFPDKEFSAKIKRISPVVDSESGTFRVTVGIHDKMELLKPGMFVNVNIVTSVHRDVVLIPKQAVLYENDLPIVYVLQDSIALKVRLMAGFDDNRYIESMGNILPGDSIITVGQTGLKDSARVKIIDMEKIRKEAIKLAEANAEKLKQKKSGSDKESDSNE